jgi:hypothetical protein
MGERNMFVFIFFSTIFLSTIFLSSMFLSLAHVRTSRK